MADEDILNPLPVDDLVGPSPPRTLLAALSQEFTAIMEADGVSLADLLQGLEEERQALARERRVGKE